MTLSSLAIIVLVTLGILWTGGLIFASLRAKRIREHYQIYNNAYKEETPINDAH